MEMEGKATKPAVPYFARFLEREDRGAQSHGRTTKRADDVGVGRDLAR